MTGPASTRDYKMRCISEGRCPHCGKPCAPFTECEDRRRYKRERYLKRGMVWDAVRGNHPPAYRRPRHNPDAEKPRFHDWATCNKCGARFGRTFNQAHAYLNACHACRSEYRRELRLRAKVGLQLGRPCAICGEPMHVLSKRQDHYSCAWDKTIKERQDKWAEIRREMKHPTKEETWLRKSRALLWQAKTAARDACRSPSEESRPAKTSRSCRRLTDSE